MQKPPETTLQPPGAGLPWWELAALRCGFRFDCMTTSHDKAMRRFMREADRILSLVAGLDPRQGARRVLIGRITAIEDSSRFWSVYMVLDHLNIVDSQIVRIVELLLSGQEAGADFLIQDVKPDAEAGPESLDAFKRGVQYYESTLGTREKLKSSHRHVHPWFGAIDAHAWHCLAGIHHGIHRRQIARILRELDTERSRI